MVLYSEENHIFPLELTEPMALYLVGGEWVQLLEGFFLPSVIEGGLFWEVRGYTQKEDRELWDIFISILMVINKCE